VASHAILNVTNDLRDQKVRRVYKKVYENLSHTWTKPEYVRQKRSDKIRDINDG